MKKENHSFAGKILHIMQDGSTWEDIVDYPVTFEMLPAAARRIITQFLTQKNIKQFGKINL